MRRPASRVTTSTAVGLGACRASSTRSAPRLRFTPNLPMADRPLRDDRRRPQSACRSSSRTTPTRRPGASTASARGRTYPDMVLVTVGTGIGGGSCSTARCYRGRFGVGGRVRPPAGRARRPAAAAAATTAAGSSTARGSRAAAPGPGAVPAATRCSARGCSTSPAGDPAALDRHDGHRGRAGRATPRPSGCFAEIGRWLGQGVAALAAVLDPAVVVVGGGVSEAGDLLLDPAREAYADGAVRRHAPAAPADHRGRAGQRRRPHRRRRPRPREP